MLNRLSLLAVLALGLFVVSGCDGTTDDDFTSQLVVSAFLGANEPLPPVVLSRTLPLFEVYTPEAAAVGGAEVRLTLVGADGSDEAVYAYVAGNAPGEYVWPPSIEASDFVTVLPERTYRLDIVADGETLTATTLVPPGVELIEGPGEFVEYGSGQGPELRITRSSTAARRAAFVASTSARGADDFEEIIVGGETRYRSQNLPGRYRPAPIYQRFLGCEEEGEFLICDENPLVEGVLIGTSPVINEASYIDNGDGSLTVQIPYLAFGFLGPQVISLVSLDAAFQDFIETQAVQGGGSTLSPGEIPNVTTNIGGGLGVFGSFSRVGVFTTLTDPFAP